MSMDPAARGLASQALSANAAKNSIPGVFNFDPAFLAKWRYAVVSAKLGTGPAKVVCMGTSLTANSNGTFAGSGPVALAKTLTGVGLTATSDFWWGDAAISSNASIATYDVRRNAATAAWGRWSENMGGAAFLNTTTTADTLAFTPTLSFDKIVTYPFVTGAGFGTFTVDVGGVGAVTHTTTNGSQTILAQTDAVTPGSGTINVKRLTGSVYIAGQGAYLSTRDLILVINAGRGSATSAQMANNTGAFNSLSALIAVAPDLTIIEPDTNDLINAVAQGTSLTNVQAIITAAKLSGDAILVKGPTINPAGTGLVAQSTQDAMNAALRALAVQNNIPFLDTPHRLGSPWATAVANGWTGDSLVHLKDQGYFDWFGGGIAQIVRMAVS